MRDDEPIPLAYACALYPRARLMPSTLRAELRLSVDSTRTTTHLAHRMCRHPATITQADIALALSAAKQTNKYVGMHLYVIGPKRGPVKIGISGSAHARIAYLQVGHPLKLEVLAEVAVPYDGDIIEGIIHGFFAPYRTRPNGEWFHRTSEVSLLIEMARCRLSLDLIIEKLRAACAEEWQRFERVERAANDEQKQ